MNNTYFENSNGLDDTANNHLTSAMDIAIMSRELIKHEDILKYSSTWMDSIRNGEFGLTNTNRLIRFYNGATGLKTGSTSKAMFCVSATAKRGNMHLICVIMGAPSSATRNSIATELLNWGFSNFELYLDSSEKLTPIKVSGGTADKCHIYSEDFAVVVKKGTASKIIKKLELPSKINAPLEINDKIGSINYYFNDQKIGESAVLSSENIEKIDFLGLFIRILSKFLLK
jgi:D-alanyl-D-alanine carboxypeptidase (penicillin-binding protein 5/6)